MPSFVRGIFALLLVAWVLTGCATPSPSVHPPRTIHLVQNETREFVHTTYWRDGGYVRQAMQDISVLMRDRRTSEVHPIDPRLIDILYDIVLGLGLPAGTPVEVTSGYRSRESNLILTRTNGNVGENSYHVRGQAADIRIPGVSPPAVAEMARRLGRGGYAYYPSSSHTHVDTGPVRTWPVR